MKMKKLVALGAAAAMSMAMCVNVFAEYVPNTPADTTATHTAGTETAAENIKLNNVAFMNDGEQYTVILFKVDTDASGNVDVESVNRTLTADDLLYINQGDKTEEFWSDTGMGPKGTGLEDGTYIMRIGGESLSQVYEIAVEVKGEVILYGDIYKDGKVNARDRMLLNQRLGNLVDDKAIWFDAADLYKDGKINARDRMLLNQLLGNLIGQSDLPQGQ